MPLSPRRTHATREQGATRKDIIVGIASAALIAAVAVPVFALQHLPAPAPTPSASALLTPATFTARWTGAGYSVTQGTGADSDFLIARDGTGAEKARLKHVVASHVKVTTLFGGAASFSDGTVSTASMSTPADVAVDRDGNVFFTDSGNNAVRKVTPSGQVVTIAGGDPIGGFADGTHSLAKFNGPRGIAVDATGNLYVADEYNNAIRKISPAGFVTTIAGSGIAGFADGMNSLFSHPTSLAVDAAGTVYVADTMNFRIRTIAATGNVSTLAGGRQGHLDGRGTSARFSYPEGIALDGAGNLYVADPVDHTIRQVSPTGAVTTFAGSRTAGHANGLALDATFTSPSHLSVDAAGTVYVSDPGTRTIRQINAGQVSTYAGTGNNGKTDGSAAKASFEDLGGLAAKADGTLVIADSGNNLLRLIHR